MNLITPILFYWVSKFSPEIDYTLRTDSSAVARDNEKQTHFDGQSFPYSCTQASHE